MTWQFEAEATDSESHKIAQDQFDLEVRKVLEEHLPPEVWQKLTIKVKANRCAERVSRKARVGGPFNPEEVLKHRRVSRYAGKGNEVSQHHTSPDEDLMDWKAEDGTIYKVSMVSQRYHLFARDNCTCQACGLVGTEMYLERDRSTKEGRAHFNLYAIEDGRQVLFTKDHILASSNGGPDRMDNLQTYCEICNLLKGKAFLTNQQVAELRKVYNERKNGHKNKLAAILKQTKAGIAEEASYGRKKTHLTKVAEAKQKALEPRLRLNTTIAVMPQPNKPNFYHGIRWAELREKTRQKAKMVLEAGTILQVNRSSATAVVCFLDEEGTKITIPHLFLEPVDEQEKRQAGGAGGEVQGQGLDNRTELGGQPEGVVGGP
jgi:5-methylcytosine-specific restriction endonuclease McrA